MDKQMRRDGNKLPLDWWWSSNQNRGGSSGESRVRILPPMANFPLGSPQMVDSLLEKDTHCRFNNEEIIITVINLNNTANVTDNYFSIILHVIIKRICKMDTECTYRDSQHVIYCQCTNTSFNHSALTKNDNMVATIHDSFPWLSVSPANCLGDPLNRNHKELTSESEKCVQNVIPADGFLFIQSLLLCGQVLFRTKSVN